VGKVTVKTMDGQLVDYRIHGGIVPIEWEEIADTSEQRLHAILTEFFPDWQHATWWYTWDWDHSLWAKIIGMEIDGKFAYDILKARLIEYLEHPLEDLEKQFELRLDETYLATQGITELRRDEAL
jgi:hypothetical protein